MMLDIPLRADALPEYVTYRDKGCRVHPQCLTCPFERCVLEVPLAVQVSRRKARRMRDLRASGMAIDQIAAEVGVSRRSVFRALKPPQVKRGTTGGEG